MEKRTNKTERRTGEDKRIDVVKLIEGERRSDVDRRSRITPSKIEPVN